MRAFCFTVDLDRDVNIHIPGQHHAGSIDRGDGTMPRFSSTDKGLSILIDLMDEIGIKATFFAEAETLERIETAHLLSGHEVGLHGYHHEDLTLMDNDDLENTLRTSFNIVRDITGRSPKSFRAPYMRTNDRVMSILPSLGITADSSYYADLTEEFMPYKQHEMTEIPVPEGLDESGKKISAYLWPMHEGKRSPQDYIRMARRMDNGAFTIATHTWHMVESRDKGRMSLEEIKKNRNNVKKVLEGLIDSRMRVCTINEAVRLFPHNR